MEDSNKTLGKIFGSPQRAKVLRFFMQNHAAPYPATVIAEKTGLTSAVVAREGVALQSAGVLRRKNITLRSKAGGKGKQVPAWVLNDQFPYRATFESFFADALELDEPMIIKTLLRIGRIKYIALSGIWTSLNDARVDILVVGEILQPAVLARAVRKIEHAVCRDIKVVFLTTGDFEYRKNVNDRLLRDIFDFPHKISVDKLQNGPSYS
jgi:hypothetical protein